MSNTFNPNLFIPRKDRLAAPSAIASSCGVDPHHLDQALRTNFLTIERWANQGLFSAAMAQSVQQALVLNTGVPEPLTNFTQLWSAASAVDTANSRFKVPATGIYLASLECDFISNSTTTTVDQAASFIFASSSAATPFSAQTLMPEPWPATGTAHMQTSLLFKCSLLPCYVRASAFTVTPSTSPANGTVLTSGFSLVRIGAIPSNVQ